MRAETRDAGKDKKIKKSLTLHINIDDQNNRKSMTVELEMQISNNNN